MGKNNIKVGQRVMTCPTKNTGNIWGTVVNIRETFKGDYLYDVKFSRPLTFTREEVWDGVVRD